MTRLTGTYTDPVNWATATGTGTDGAAAASSTDFTAASGSFSLSLAPPTNTTTFTIQTTPDSLIEGTEFFLINFTDVNNQTQTKVVETIEQQIIAPTNSAPDAKDDTLAATEDTAATFTVAQLTGNDTDANGDALTVSAMSGATGGTVLLNSDGTVTFTPTPNFLGTGSFTYTVSDGKGGTDTATATVTIAAVNDAPTGAATGTLPNGTEDTTYSGSVATLLEGFSDADGNALSVSNLRVSGGTVALNGDGTYTVTPATDANGPVTLTYDVTDGRGGTVSDVTRAFSLAAVNDAPEITSAAATRDIAETDGALSASGEIDWTDVDAGDTQTLTQVAAVTATGIVLTVAQTQAFVDALTLSQDGTWSFVLAAQGSQFLAVGDSVEAVYTVTVTDGAGGTDTQDITATVTGTNDGPVANTDSATTTENVGISVDVLANDTDVDDGATRTLLSGVLVSGLGSVEVVGGELVYDPGSAYNHLAQDAEATVTLSYVMEDEHEVQSTSTVTVTVTGQNDGPTANGDTAAGGENQTLTLDVQANDTDPDDGATLRLVSGSAPAGKGSASVVDGKLVFDPGTGFDYLQEGQTTKVTLGYVIEDEFRAQATSSVEVTIAGSNDAPVALYDAFGIGDIKVYEGMEFSLDGSVGGHLLWNDSDVDGGTLGITGVTNGAKGTVRLVTDVNGTVSVVYTYTGPALAENATSDDMFTYTISDGQGGTTTASVNLRVTGLANKMTMGTNQIDIIDGKDLVNDTINALNADDTVYGYSGNDRLFGNNGIDRLFGGDGADVLDGGNGNDRLDGGKGNDTLIGGLGADTFVFARVDGAVVHTGADVITDFKLGTDDIVLGAGITIASATSGEYGGTTEQDTLLRLSNGGTVELLGVSGLTTEQWILIA